MLRSGVAIVQSVSRVFEKLEDGRKILIHDEKPYWCVSSRSLGQCGHKHRTKKACEPCYKVMMARHTKRRREISTKIWHDKRRARIMAREYDASVTLESLCSSASA